MKASACPTCEYVMEWNMDRLQKVDERWVIACEKCGSHLFSVTAEEKAMILEGMRLTAEYVPDIINAYKAIEHLPSKVAFGVIKKSDSEDE